MDRKTGLLSGGEPQMLVIGLAIMCNPRLLMLDEPGLGLSPVMVQRVLDASGPCRGCSRSPPTLMCCREVASRCTRRHRR
ncbi:ATP-binding cassette domain-containing protein [Bradyrhizobium sp. HKCCYLRH3099]